MHSLDLGHPSDSVIPSAAGPVLSVLAGAEAWLSPTQVTELLAGRCLAACLFGSAARGDGNPASDVDVLLVRPDDARRAMIRSGSLPSSP